MSRQYGSMGGGPVAGGIALNVQDRLSGSFLHCAPKIAVDRVAEGMRMHVTPHALPESVAPDIGIDHGDHGSAFVIGDAVERLTGLIGGQNGLDDGMGGRSRMFGGVAVGR